MFPGCAVLGVLALLSQAHGQGPMVGGTLGGMGPRVLPGPPTPFLTGSTVYSTCYFNGTYSAVRGRVDMRQNLAQTPPMIEMRVQVMGLPKSTMSDMEHAMHVHQWGDTTRECYSAGPHFDTDPFSVHGGPTAVDRSQRHDGDLGNLRQTNDGIIDTTFNVQNMMIVGDQGILGRSVVLHEGRDDLGRGTTMFSSLDGNSGPPIACCVVGLADVYNWNNPIFTQTKPGPGPINPMNPMDSSLMG